MIKYYCDICEKEIEFNKVQNCEISFKIPTCKIKSQFNYCESEKCKQQLINKINKTFDDLKQKVNNACN